MQTLPAHIILLIVFFATLVLSGAALALVPGLSEGGNKRVKRLKDRYKAGKKEAKNRVRSILADPRGSRTEEALKRIIPQASAIRKHLARAGINISLSKYALISAILGVFTGLLLYFGAGAPFALALAAMVAAAFGLPHLYVKRAIKKRTNRFLALFPDAIDLITRSLRSGLPIMEAVKNVGAEIEDPVGTEFRKVSDAVKMGKNLEAALWQAADRIDAPDFRFFVISLTVQKETGGNLAETLDNLSDILRRRHQMKLKVRAMSSEGRASALIVGGVPFVMFGIFHTLNPDYISVLYTDMRASTIAVGGLLWMGLGFLIMKKMINFEV